MRLIDGDALMEYMDQRLQDLITEYGCLDIYVSGFEAAMALADTTPTIDIAPAWIPVEERLPEQNGGLYLCLLKFPKDDKAFPFCLTWHAYGDNGYVQGAHFSAEGLDGLHVTHWMPIPEAPKEVNHADN